MDKAELLESLKTLTEAVEKSCNDGAQDAGEIVTDILDDTDISCTYETVRKIVSAIVHYSDSTKMSFAKCINEDGWAKIGEEVPIDTVVSALETMQIGDMRKACRDLVDELIGRNVALCNMFFDALKEHQIYAADTDPFNEAAQEWAEQHDYFKQGSEEFEDAAHEWADDNGLYDIKDFSFEDLADKYESSEVRDFVVAYIEEHL